MSYFDPAERDAFLTRLGHKGYADFLQSALWKLISQEILRRDAHCCRRKGCHNSAQLIRPINYAPRTLLGIKPHNLVSLCDECLVAYKDDPESLTQAVTGIKPTKGISDSRIGFWYRNQAQCNQPIRERIIKRIYRYFPEVYSSKAFLEALTE